MMVSRFTPLLLVLFCIALVQSAPLPESQTLQTRAEGDILVSERSLNTLFERNTPEGSLLRGRPPQTEESRLARRDSLVRRESLGAKIKHAFQKIGKGIKKGFEKVGQGIKKAAQKVGQGIKTAAKKVGEGVKTAAKKVGQGVKTAAKKVGQFVKTTGAKIAKFGLQVWSTAQSIGAKVAKFIPGIGKPISTALDAASKVTGLAAQKIPANLGGKLQKGFDVMNKIKNPVGGAAGAVIGALRRDIDDESVFLERDIDEYNAVFERDFVNSDDLWVRSTGDSELHLRNIFRREYD